MKTFKLSPSSISLMLECPRCFWLEQKGIWFRPKTPSSSLPNGMDLIIKRHFDRFMSQKKLPPELMASECKDSCKLFDDKMLLSIWRDSRHGLSFKDEEGNILHGAIDSILVKDNKLIVLDYKTRGFPLKDNTHEYYQNQLDIYTFLLQKNSYETEDFAFLLFYYPREVLESSEIIFDTKLMKINVNTSNAELLWGRALKLLNSECPQEKCEWCNGID